MKFSRITSLDKFPATLNDCIVAIGNFDGVHRGHQAVLNTAVNIAKQEGKPVCTLTFEPHPRTFFAPEKPVPRLTPAPVKAELIESLGFDAVVEHPFTRELANTSAYDFITHTLIEQMKVSHVVTGYDFHFAKGREGNPHYLERCGEEMGYRTTIVPAFEDENGEVISSSRIRGLLQEGDIAQANGLLGYVYRISGTVEKGAQLGRTLGYPTANINLPTETPLAHGIYAVKVRLADGKVHDGVASYGRRPTFDNGKAIFETFIFDFSQDLYDQEISISLYSWLRGEEKFSSTEKLVEQMNVDSEEARSHLSSVVYEQGYAPIVNL